MALQDRLNAIEAAITNLSPKVDPSVKTALENISLMLADLRKIVVDISAEAIYTK